MIVWLKLPGTKNCTSVQYVKSISFSHSLNAKTKMGLIKSRKNMLDILSRKNTQNFKNASANNHVKEIEPTMPSTSEKRLALSQY